MTTTKTASPPTPPAGLLAVMRSLPGGSALAFQWWPEAGIEVVIGASIQVLALHPGASRADLGRLEHEVWNLARARPVGPSGEPLDVMLARAAGVTPLRDLRALLEVLMAAGDLAATLTSQRRSIDAMLEQIAQVRNRKA